MSACSAACTAPITRPGSSPAVDQRLEGHRVPAGPCGQFPGREVERHDLEHRVGRRAAPLVGDDVVADGHRAEVRAARPQRHRLLGGEDGDVGLLAGLGELVGVVGRFEQRHVVLEVEVAHAVLTALVQVHRAGVGDVERP